MVNVECDHVPQTFISDPSTYRGCAENKVTVTMIGIIITRNSKVFERTYYHQGAGLGQSTEAASPGKCLNCKHVCGYLNTLTLLLTGAGEG